MPPSSFLTALLLGAAGALAVVGPTRAEAQAQDDGALDEVTVTGQSPPGAVIGDIPPENSLTPRDIRSYGVGTVSELLDEIALQTTSGQSRGDGGPVILVNGRRISGVNEVSDLPTEAILRLDILPEEVALKYGYSAEQKVVNVILRRRFQALTADVAGGGTTDGGGDRLRADGTTTRIRENRRLNVAVAAQTQGSITEAQRGLAPLTVGPAADPAHRTLQPSRQNLSANAVYAMPLTDLVSASANLTATHSESHSLNGLAATAPGSLESLDQFANATTLHLGGTLNADFPSAWRFSLTGTYDHATSHTDTERVRDPLAGVPSLDRALATSDTADVSILATRKLFGLPAGDLLLSLRGGLHSGTTRSELTGTRSAPARTISRTSGDARVSLDVPVTKRNGWGGAIGSLTANLNGSVTAISDFETLKTFGYGLNWSPFATVSIIAAMSEDRRAPTVQQLVSPMITLVNAPVYDYVTGQTVLVTSTTGGNPSLDADDRRTFKLAATIKPFTNHDFTLTANFSDSRTRNAIQSLPGVSPPLEAAFPDRFVRDEDGELLAYDVRPINVASQNRSSLRWGFNLTRVLREPRRPQFPPGARPVRPQGASTPQRTSPPQGQASAPTSDAAPGASDEVVVSGQRPQADDRPPLADRFGGRRGGAFGGGGGFPGGGGRGFPGGFGRGPAFDDGTRLQLSVYHTWLFRNEVTLRSGLAPLDLLGGNTLGGSPPSRHQVQVNGGITDNGIGYRLSGQWRSSDRVVDLSSREGNLRFGGLATLDLRIFADLGQRLPRTSWARGLRATLTVQNLFDSRQKVSDDLGVVPLAYQGAYLDPVGRVALLSLRKIF